MQRPCVIYGGAPAVEQMSQLRKGCDATPGRLLDNRSMLRPIYRNVSQLLQLIPDFYLVFGLE